MLCSARELGLGTDHDGILELDTPAAPGERFREALGLGDDRLVVDVTPNRPDLLGHKGVARELAHSYGIAARLPEIPGSAGVVPSPRRLELPMATVGGVEVAIEHPEGCRRFLAAVVRGVGVGPSPAWLQRRVQAVGMRSINNVVDATNYVMFELNQPMHAYDVARIRGARVSARRAEEGERLTTLDDVSRVLTRDMTVIADREGAVGIAGVMGAAHVEVGPATRDLFLECAWFDPRETRRTRKRLGLSTEASYRFERGVDLWNGPEAIRRCIELILATAGGALAEPPLDLWPRPEHPARVFVRPARVAQVLGVDLPWDALEKALTAIGATVLAKPDDGRMAVDVPGWRPDIVREIDLIEEIARIHGYENFPMDLRPFRMGTVPDAPSEQAASRVRRGLAEQGLLEVGTLPMGPEDGAESVRVLNPLSAEDGFLRRRLLPGLVRQVERNWAEQVRSVRLFELGTVFSNGEPGRQPNEEYHAAGVITGARAPRHWSGDTTDLDLWDLKGLMEAAASLAFPAATVQVEGSSWVARAPDGRVVGQAVRLSADAPPWAAPVFGFEIAIDPSPAPPRRYRALPVTPAATRDLALVLPLDLPVGRVIETIHRGGGVLLEAAGVLNEFRGAGLPADRRSVAFHLSFRAADRTLEKPEVDQAVNRILKTLEKDLGVHLREA